MHKKISAALQWKGTPLFDIVIRHNPATFNFVSERFQNSDDLILFGFDDENIIMHEKYTWANIASEIGLFPSAGIARKSGFSDSIEEGFSEAFFTKSDGTPLVVFILK